MASIEALPQQSTQRLWAFRLPAHFTVGFLLLIGVAVLTLVPVLVVIIGSFDIQQTGNPATFSLDAWRQTLLESPRTQSAIAFSFLLALRAPAAALVAFFLAWLLIRTQLPGRSIIEFAFWLAFFFPILPIALGWILLLDPDSGLVNLALKHLIPIDGPIFNIFSVAGILWVHVTAASVPVMVILLGPAIRQLDATLEEAARVCGASPLKVFRKITLPILAPAVLTGALAGFIRSLEAFEVEQLLGRPAGIYVYSTRIYDLITWEPPLFPQAMALSTFMLTVLVIIALFYQRFSSERHFATITGRSAAFHPLITGRWRYIISAFLFTLITITVVLPITMLVSGSFMKLFGFFTINEPFTIQHWLQVLRDPVFLLSLRNSLLVGLGTASCGVLLYAILAYTLTRSRLFGRRMVDILVWLPWTIPGILLGIGLLWLVLATPLRVLLYGSISVLILALLVKDLPIGTHMMKASIGQIGIELEQSSHVCGAGTLTTFRRIVIPLMRPMLVSIFVLVFISALRDISTTILLVSPATRTLSILMLEYATSSAVEASAVVGVILSTLTIAVALVARRLGLQVVRD